MPLILTKVGGWGSFVEAAPEGPPHASGRGLFRVVPNKLDDRQLFRLRHGLVLCTEVGLRADGQRCKEGGPPDRKTIFGKSHFSGCCLHLSIVVNQSADTEQAYILACQYVLPAGMMGLMVAAMASATASMATTRLNVFASAFTEAYHNMMGKDASEKRLVFVGRMITLILGIVVIGGALMIPKYGYTKFIVDINKLLYVPLFLPVWGCSQKD